MDFLLDSHMENSYLKTDMCKFESSQKDENRAHSADSSKAYRKPRTFNWTYKQFTIAHMELIFLLSRDKLLVVVSFGARTSLINHDKVIMIYDFLILCYDKSALS